MPDADSTRVRRVSLYINLMKIDDSNYLTAKLQTLEDNKVPHKRLPRYLPIFDFVYLYILHSASVFGVHNATV